MSKYALKMMAKGMAARAISLRVKERYQHFLDDGARLTLLVPEDRRREMIVNTLKRGGVEPTPELVEKLFQKSTVARNKAARVHRERTHIHRKNSRALHLARMFVKGVSYKMVEKSCYEKPLWNEVAKYASLVTPSLANWWPQEADKPEWALPDRPVEWAVFENWMQGN